MIEAVLWDNDGVLVDSETRFFETTRAAFARIGLTLTREIWGRHYMGEGKSSHDIAVMMGAESRQVKPMLEERNQDYMQVLRQPPPLRPQVRETLSRLHGRVRMAIVTGCHRDQLRLMHDGNGLLGLFEAIVTGDECPHAKPHPGLYLAGLKKLGVPAEGCLAVEDSPRGLAAARVAGVACMVVPTELTCDLDFAGAVSVQPDVSAVLNYFPGRL
jgi:HAD superfamily hydrolase (TIGR01509 family)